MPGDGDRGFEPPPVPRLKFNLPKIGAVLVIVVCGIAIFFAAVPSARNYFMGYEIVVSKPASKGHWVSGSFRFQHKWLGHSWNGMGGACAVADIAKLVRADDPHKDELRGACTTQADCNPAKEYQEWYGYCVARPNEAGRCWYKPVAGDDEIQLCRRSIDYDPKKIWTLGEDNRLPEPGQLSRFDVQQFYRDHTNGQAADWALIGVLVDGSGEQHASFGESAKLE